MQSKATSVAAYLKEVPQERRDVVVAVRETILANLPPGYEEGMQYGMIGYFVPHRIYPDGYHCDPTQPLPYAALAAQKNYVSLYLMCIYSNREQEAWFRDAWLKTFMPRGAFLAGRVEQEHWLTFGTGPELPLLVADMPVLMAAEGVDAPVRFGVLVPAAAPAAGPKSASADDEEEPARRVGWAALPEGQDLRLRMSGLLWPEALLWPNSVLWPESTLWAEAVLWPDADVHVYAMSDPVSDE